MTMCYAYHRITVEPLDWRGLARQLVDSPAISRAGGALYGIWRSQIGRPRDEISVITHWPEPVAATDAEVALATCADSITGISTEIMHPTLRPTHSDRPTRQGNFAFRWFSTPAENWDEFLALCGDAWPGFEAAYDSQVIGLWRMSEDRTGGLVEEATGAGISSGIRSLLFTRRPDLAMWERSKLPQGPAETKVRETLSRRYDLCDWTTVYTSTLLTAEDAEDNARWA
ncbi:MAG: hypothetical protein P8N43_06100 [Alphaproteobacteria bacterium]|jgi:hypothetical protein|nr:hypothetical protein [Alphaproteobacteria bacterium]